MTIGWRALAPLQPIIGRGLKSPRTKRTIATSQVRQQCPSCHGESETGTPRRHSKPRRCFAFWYVLYFVGVSKLLENVCRIFIEDAVRMLRRSEHVREERAAPQSFMEMRPTGDHPDPTGAPIARRTHSSTLSGVVLASSILKPFMFR